MLTKALEVVCGSYLEVEAEVVWFIVHDGVGVDALRSEAVLEEKGQLTAQCIGGLCKMRVSKFVFVAVCKLYCKHVTFSFLLLPSSVFF